MSNHSIGDGWGIPGKRNSKYRKSKICAETIEHKVFIIEKNSSQHSLNVYGIAGNKFIHF